MYSHSCLKLILIQGGDHSTICILIVNVHLKHCVKCSLLTEKDLQAGGGKKAYDYLKLYRTNKILCSIPFRKDLQAEAERKKQNRKDSDPPGEISNVWATCSDQNIYSTNLLHTILYIIFYIVLLST